MKNIYLLILLSNHLLFGQAFSFSSIQNGQSIKHRVLMDDEYIVETQFISSSSQFVKTIGASIKKMKTISLLTLNLIQIFQTTV